MEVNGQLHALAAFSLRKSPYYFLDRSRVGLVVVKRKLNFPHFTVQGPTFLQLSRLGLQHINSLSISLAAPEVLNYEPISLATDMW
jgi:hypothetical protein